MRQSFAWWCVREQVQDAPQFLRDCQLLGYEGVELLPRELWPAAREAGLVIATESCGSLTEGWNRREHHAGLLEELKRKLDDAGQWNIPNLIVFSGNRAGQADAVGLEICAEGLRKAAALAEASGVTLVLELLNSKVDHRDYQCDHTAWGAAIVDQVGSPRVKLLYDIYHMQIMEGDLIRTIRSYADRFGHVHTAGNPGRQDLDGSQEINYPPLMRALAEKGYQGFVGQEFLPKGEALTALKTAFEICRVG